MGAGTCRENRVARLVANLSSTNCKEWIPSSRNPASVHWTLAFRFSSLYDIRTKSKGRLLPPFYFWKRRHLWIQSKVTAWRM